MAQSARSIIMAVAQQDGIPYQIPLAIATHESGLNANANVVDTNGYRSVGLFQLNQAGVGAGYSVRQLQNPLTNASIAIRAMLGAYKASLQRGLKGTQQLDYVANNSGWPDSSGVAFTQRVEPAYDVGLNSVYTGGSVARPASTAGSLTTGTASVFKALDDHMSVSLTGFNPVDNWTPVTSSLGAMGLRLLLFLLALTLIGGAIAMVVGSGIAEVAHDVPMPLPV